MRTFKDAGKRRPDEPKAKALRKIRKLRRFDSKQNRAALAALYIQTKTQKEL